MDEVKPAARLPTVEHREPCESRGSRTVLGAPGGEIPPATRPKRTLRTPCARLTRSKTGVLEVALHTNDGTLAFNGYTHEQFVDLFHAIGSDRDNRVVILTGSGNAFMETISPEGFDFFTPRGYDKIYREGRKVLMNILDIEVPLIAAVDGPMRLHTEYILADVARGSQK